MSSMCNFHRIVLVAHRHSINGLSPSLHRKSLRNFSKKFQVAFDQCFDKVEMEKQNLMSGVAVMMIRELFDFIVDPSITDESVDSYLEKAQQKVLARGDTISVEDEIADSVFVQSYIPKTLDDVMHAEEDVNRITSGQDTGDMLYKTITGLKEALATAQPSLPERGHQQKPGDIMLETPTDREGHINSQEIESEDETDESEDSVIDSDEEGSMSENETKRPEDIKAARKENKKKVKEEKREARKTKIPKAVKKKKKKLAKAKKTR